MSASAPSNPVLTAAGNPGASATTEPGSYGLPVEPGKIDKALKQMWLDAEGVSTRASLVNLAVYSEEPDGLEQGSALISELTRTHACRAILINAQSAAAESRVQAWINVHCHITRAGAKQVCCEQISFLLEGAATLRIPSIVFSHLDSDLPLVFCWLGPLHEFPDSRLWSWVDKLIVDSLNWANPKQELAMLRDMMGRAPRLSVRDINWMRSVYLRGALTQVFDHPSARQMLGDLAEIEIHHTPERRLTALLVVGWLSARLNWQNVRRNGGDFIATMQPGAGEPSREICIRLREAAGEGFSRMTLATTQGDAEVSITRERGAAHYTTTVRLPGEGTTTRLLPAGTRGVCALLNEELARGSRSRNSEIALERILELL